MPALDRSGQTKTSLPIPYGSVAMFSGATLPAGWLLCDGANGTPDLRDRFLVGAAAAGFGSASGTVSATAALTHAGAAVAAHSAHVVTQAATHAAHVVGQAAAHVAHVVGQGGAHGNHASDGAHVHDDHATATGTAATTTVMTGPTLHTSEGGHTHDAHSAHTGADLDVHSAHLAGNLGAHSAHTGTALDAHSAHSVTQPSSHAVAKHFLLAYVMFVGLP